MNEKVSRGKRNDEALKQHTLGIYQAPKQYGYPLVKVILRDREIIVYHKKMYRFMCELDVHSIIRKKRRVWKNQVSRIFDNVVDRQYSKHVANEVFVTDLTYLFTKNRFLYSSAVQDLYNNEILVWKIRKGNNLQLFLDTLEELTSKRNVYRSILHSDQGFQNTSLKYHQRVEQLSMIGNHSR